MVKSVLGKLIQREFGKERYACYADKLKEKTKQWRLSERMQVP